MNPNRTYNVVRFQDGPFAGQVRMIDARFIRIAVPIAMHAGPIFGDAAGVPQYWLVTYLVTFIAPDDPAFLYLDAWAFVESVR